MPIGGATLTGSFSPADGVQYTVEHYKENDDGSYTLADTETKSGRTGETAQATPKTYEGYTFDSTVAGTVLSGTIVGDGSLVLRLFYTKNPPAIFTITYYLNGVVYKTVGAEAGRGYALEPAPALSANQTFSGWSAPVANGTEIPVINNTFTMPAANVDIYGTTNVLITDYKVTYYINNNVYQVVNVKAGEVHKILPEPLNMTQMFFTGWSNPYNTVTNEYFAKGKSSFVMPEADVEISGTFIPIIPVETKGTIEISKSLTAPSGFDKKDTFEFDIYKQNGTLYELVDTVLVKAGATVRVTVEAGSYMVTEKNAEVNGYTLETRCTNTNNIVVVAAGKSSSIGFENVYRKPELIISEHFAYIIGTDEGLVEPNKNITRAEVATIFFRMLTDESRDYYWAETNKFPDVNEDDWFNIAVSTLANAGIIAGRDDGTFGPNIPITRAELVKLAVSFYDAPVGSENHFSDIKEHWADDFINAAYDLGLVVGGGDGTFRPNDYITRAETMTIVNRTLKRAPDKDHLLEDMIEWPDNMDTDKWYYAQVQEATNSHTYVMAEDYEVWKELRPVRDWAALELGWYEAHKKDNP